MIQSKHIQGWSMKQYHSSKKDKLITDNTVKGLEIKAVREAHENHFTSDDKSDHKVFKFCTNPE